MRQHSELDFIRRATFRRVTLNMNEEETDSFKPEKTDLGKLISERFPQLNIIPRSFCDGPEGLYSDMKAALSETVDDKTNVILFPEYVLGVPSDFTSVLSKEDADKMAAEIASTHHKNTYAFYAIPTFEEYILVRGYLLDMEKGSFRSYRKNAVTKDLRKLNGEFTLSGITDEPLTAGDMSFYACADVLDRPPQSGLGIVAACGMKVAKVFSEGMKLAKAPSIILDPYTFGLYFADPARRKVFYENF